MKRALILGVSGQDGALLAQELLSKGYIVDGGTRMKPTEPIQNLTSLGIANQVNVVNIDLTNFYYTDWQIRRCQPDEIYILSGESSVAKSFLRPAETIRESIVSITNILEVSRSLKAGIKIFFAGSGECFGDTQGLPADEDTCFCPRSPYAVAKASCHWIVRTYREAFGVFACTGILFNHESSLRPAHFVTSKVITTAKRIAAGSREKLELGRIEVARDWGWAPEYVQAMWLMLQQDRAEDFVIATGTTHTLEQFVEHAFYRLGLDWRDHVIIDPELYRPTEITCSRANPTRVNTKLGWAASTKMEAVIDRMISPSTN